MSIRHTALVLSFTCLFAAVGPRAEERVDGEAGWAIRREATERSRVLQTLHMLTDVHGPRLTGSPQLKAAGEWAASQLTAWGLANAGLEPWSFGHPGWTNERVAGFIVAPVQDSLTCEAVAWTPGTNGAVAGTVVQVVPPDRPTDEEMAAWLASVTGHAKGRMVLIGEGTPAPVSFNPVAQRREDADVRAQYDPVNPAPSPFAQPPAPAAQEGPKRLDANEVSRRVDEWLVSEGALVRINDGGRAHGQIRAFNNRTFDVSKAVPTVVVRNEDFGRISRLVGGGREVTLEFTIVNRTHPEGATSYNVVAEIPGSDRADEIVMLGGHLDSWHAATGATDNAIGVAVMMEAVRTIQAAGLRPRRTIRIALWGGEEQGLLGSKAYVEQHFGTFESPKPDFAKLVAYFNIDAGTGRARGASVFGPPEAAAALRAALAPFEDLGVLGTAATRSRRLGGSDHTSFNQAGLPGVGLGQDPIEYGTHTWHTNLDTYERIVPADAVKSAIAIAAAVYHVATRDEALPRFTKDTMPAPPAPEGQTPAPVRPVAAGR